MNFPVIYSGKFEYGACHAPARAMNGLQNVVP